MTLNNDIVLIVKKGMIFFVLSFAIIFYFFTIFNMAKVNEASEVIKQKINNIYDIVRQITPFYLNTDDVYMKSGISYVDGIAVMVNEDHDVRSISTAINEVEKNIREIIYDDLWGIAVIQRTDTTANTAHFKPLREVHIDLNSQGLHDENWIERIMENENLSYPYNDFSKCDLKLTENYIENFSNEKIRSIFYPFYENRKLIGVVLIDIKHKFIENLIDNYNYENHSKIEISDKKPIYDFDFLPSVKKIKLPCTPIKSEYFITIDWLSVISWVLVYSSILSLFFMAFEYSRKLINLAISKDKMTGLMRRDVFERCYKSKQKDCAVIIVDIDNFKLINDNHGHLIGDDVIRKVSGILLNSIRIDDIAIRWGGEEFVILLDIYNKDEIAKRAESIRKQIAENTISGMIVTVSIGVCISKDIPFEAKFKHADDALYQAKKNGRNQVVCYA
ncbi:GGDEF domain-containing protein [Photobacterium leiognathi]|uniref:GGDEF domain-containing protein n=1 Tax=Photobacterium leiognathi TaxID=553611 RepID=UPI0029812D10|nr:GGDEF domain-containing protein [Photobacterium leiognathi]